MSRDPHHVDMLYRVSEDGSFDGQARRELIRGSCVRSGACCLAAPCPVAQSRGEQFGQRCSYLRGDTPGGYACQLALDGDEELIASVGIGTIGCPDPRNMDRLAAGRNQTEARRKAVDGPS